MTLLYLFGQFFLMGLLAMGGGLAIIPFAQEIVNQTPTMSETDLSNIIALAEMTPGAVGVNIATYLGNNISGISGGITATFGLICPAFFIVWLVHQLWEKAKDNPVIASVFNATKSAVIGLLSSISLFLFLSMIHETHRQFLTIGLFIGLFITVLRFKINPILYILGMGIIGILLKL